MQDEKDSTTDNQQKMRCTYLCACMHISANSEGLKNCGCDPGIDQPIVFFTFQSHTTTNGPTAKTMVAAFARGSMTGIGSSENP
jgi:hypothetical protein